MGSRNDNSWSLKWRWNLDSSTTQISRCKSKKDYILFIFIKKILSKNIPFNGFIPDHISKKKDLSTLLISFSERILFTSRYRLGDEKKREHEIIRESDSCHFLSIQFFFTALADFSGVPQHVVLFLEEGHKLARQKEKECECAV